MSNPSEQPKTDPEPSASIAATRIHKFPEFRKEYPEFWISQVESTFRNHNITRDQTKFDYLLQYSPPEILPHIVTLATNPPPDGERYDAIKKRIIDAFSESEEAKVRRVLQGRSLGGQKPSHFLVELRNTAGSQVSDAVLRSIFIEQLPDHAKYILAVTEDKNLDNLARLADRVVEVQGPTIAATTAATKPPVTPDDQTYHSMARQLSELTTRVNQLETKLAQQKRERSKSRSRTRREATDSNLCYFHLNFREKARKCEKPCAWINKPEN